MKKTTKQLLFERMYTIGDMPVNEVSNELLQKINNDDRIVMTKEEEIVFRDVKQSDNSGFVTKPKGLWYAIGDAWIQWVRMEFPRWEEDHIFKLNINKDRIFFVDSEEKLGFLDQNYTNKSDNEFEEDTINWYLLSQQYDGIEVSYLNGAVYNMDWRYKWDVPSGCIWNKNAISNINKIN